MPLACYNITYDVLLGYNDTCALKDVRLDCGVKGPNLERQISTCDLITCSLLCALVRLTFDSMLGIFRVASFISNLFLPIIALMHA